MRRVWLAVVAAALASAQPRSLDLAAFDQVWTTIRDTHWETSPGGLDWEAVRAEFRPQVEAARTREEAREVLENMLRRLKQTHFAIVPSPVYAPLEAAGGGGPGATGIDVRMLDGEVVVTGVDPGSPAERAGVRPGWVVQAVNGRPLIVANLPELALTRVMLARLSGAVGDTIEVTFDHGTLRLELGEGRGEWTEFGNLPAQRVWYEERRIGNVGYVRFNAFLDIPRLMPAFERTIRNCGDCRGLIIDLRGNPGGIGGMAMGMAGFLIDRPNQRLGTMYLRDQKLQFVVNPRAEAFRGPVAVLIDGTSASTAEIFAGGLKDLGRARIFGTRSAGAALPSVFTRLPNGDGFQYAIANYVSESGTVLEGAGVQPDVEVRLRKADLLAGRDAVVDAAVRWIEQEAR
jgi:carboxyl-terminal processing protease